MTGSSVRLAGILVSLAAMLIVLPGCGGGGGGESGAPSPGTVSVLEWDPPTVDADGTPMDPKRDVGYYEFYLRTDPNFSDDDQPVAQVAGFIDVRSPNGKSFTRKLTTEFPLDNLLPFTEKGKRYYLSIRAVGVDGQMSPFMDPVAWDPT